MLNIKEKSKIKAGEYVLYGKVKQTIGKTVTSFGYTSQVRFVVSDASCE